MWQASESLNDLVTSVEYLVSGSTLGVEFQWSKKLFQSFEMPTYVENLFDMKKILSDLR